MVRRPLLAAALLALLGLGAQQSSGAPAARNGRIAFAHAGNKRGADRYAIYTMTPAGTRRRLLTANNRTISSYAPSFSSDGRHIVFVRAFRQSEIWTMNAGGGHKRRLTQTNGTDEVDPAWSPDGKEIAFGVVKPVANYGIWVMSSDGRDRRQLTTGDDSGPTWSPDGHAIAFSRYDASDQTYSIYVVPAAGGAPTDLSHESGASDLEPSWSPDGSRILFASDRTDGGTSGAQLDLWSMAADGTDLEQVTNTPDRNESEPAWSPDGRRIVYVGVGAFHGASSEQLYVSSADGSNRRKITHACGECAILNDGPSWQRLPG